MGDFSTRLARFRHQALIASAIGLVAFSFSASSVWSVPGKETAPLVQFKPNSLPASSSVTKVILGTETLELSARLNQNSINYADNVDWIIKSEEGETLFVGASQLLTLPLKPGRYQVFGRYGNIQFQDSLTLPIGQAVSINFVLEAGALRIAPHLTDEGAAPQPMFTHIYNLGGEKSGQLVKATSKAGEIIKLAAGHYRIETRYPQGNVSASTDVEVKAGIIRAVDIALHAGVVEFPSLAEGGSWTVSSGTGEHLALAQDVTELALTPGAYVAEGKLGSRMITKSFIVHDGQSLRLSLD